MGNCKKQQEYIIFPDKIVDMIIENQLFFIYEDYLFMIKLSMKVSSNITGLINRILKI